MDGRRLAFPLPASRSRSGWLLLRLRLRGGEAERCPSAREEEGTGVPSASTAPDFLTPPACDQSKPNQRICGAGRMRRRIGLRARLAAGVGIGLESESAAGQRGGRGSRS